MKKLRIGVVGLGFIGSCHLDAISRIGNAEVVAVSDADPGLLKRKAEEYGVPYLYTDIDEMLQNGEIDVIHNCTPNNLHTAINLKTLRAGKHLLSEKPLAMNAGEAAEAVALLHSKPELVAGVNYNYRMNPMVQEMKIRIGRGDIGEQKVIHGSYLQDWLMYETDYNWRLESEICGPSRAIADIGTHWMDSVQHVTGAKITEVCADLLTAFPIRQKPRGEVQSFAVNTNAEYDDKPIDTEDYGAVLFRMDNGVHGVFYVSEITAGRGCYLNFEVDGGKASVAWDQENPNRLWMGHRDQGNVELLRDPNLLAPGARSYTRLAKGHPEGWYDALRNMVSKFYEYILQGKRLGVDPCDFATFDEAHYLIRLVEAILKSSVERRWVAV